MAVYGAEAFRRLFGELIPVPEERGRALQEGDRIRLGNREILFLDTPGHANHHGCFFDPAGGNLFTGDAFGLRYPELDHEEAPFLVAPTTPVAFEPEAWLASIRKMITLEPRQACLTHFGPLTEPARWAPLLQESIEDHVAIALEEEHKHPAAGREDRLLEAVRHLLTGRARAHNPDLEEARLETLLAVDMRLNAQGLAVWLDRRARHREKGL
jgi:glyoxylase-like metal-dependent hydrolase (beta-lactamase superfamily II)